MGTQESSGVCMEAELALGTGALPTAGRCNDVMQGGHSPKDRAGCHALHHQKKQDFSQCPGRMSVQGFDFLCSWDTSSQTLPPADCRQLLAFSGLPGGSSLLQQINVLYTDSEQTTQMPQILRLPV